MIQDAGRKVSRDLSRRQVIRGLGIGAAGMLSGCATGRSMSGPGDSGNLEQFIAAMPKAELHVHLEGTVDPATAMKIAARNHTPTPYASVAEFEAALNFNSLESFLKGFHDTIAVLQTEEDFYEITYDYLRKCHAENVLYVDLKFDPQSHQRRGIAFDVFFNGIRQAQLDALNELGIASQLIMCFQRDAPLETADLAYMKAQQYRDQIVGIGLDNTEILNFPRKFADLFNRARADGFMLTSHCDLGQPNSVEHIRACLEDLKVDRLDHGYNILEDDRLVQLALQKEMCFTACPTSAFNTPDPSTRYYFSEVARSVKEMLALGLRVTINTDDPGVMGNRYLSKVMFDAAQHLSLTQDQVVTLARNAFTSLWVPDDQKRDYLSRLDQFAKSWS